MKNYPLTLQQDQSDCGPACLQSIVRFYKGDSPLESIRRLSGTDSIGTTLLGLYQAAQKLGFLAEGYRANIDELRKLDSPCILHIVIANQLEHYIVFFGVDKNNMAIIGDPGKGLAHVDLAELDSMWQSKMCLVLKPGELFQTKKSNAKAKRKWIISLIKNDVHVLSIGIAIGISISILGLCMAVFSQKLIDVVLPQKDFSKLTLFVALLVVLILIKELLVVLRQHFLIRQVQTFNARIIDFFFSRLLNLPKPFFDSRKIGEFTARLNDTARIQRVISQLASNLVIDVLLVLVLLTVIFFYSYVLGFICLCSIPVYYSLVFVHNKKIMNGQREIMSTYSLTESNYISTLQGIDPIKNFSKQTLFLVQNNSIYQRFQNAIFNLGITQIKHSFVLSCFSALFFATILCYSGYLVLIGEFKTGQLMAILSMCGSLLPSVTNLAMISIPLNEAKIAFDRMFEFTLIDPEDNGVETNVDFESLEVRNLVFRFSGKKPLLRNVSFKVQVGEIISLMGENGSGKSTIIQILQRNYAFEEGSIKINESVLLETISLHNWRASIAVVPQDIHIFSTTILENIAFDDAISKQNEVIAFLAEYGFIDFFNKIPQSYLTKVGDGGIALSGGQKQLIAIARALYCNPKLLILDEATASMDRESEQFVINLLKRIQAQMAIIFVTHRLHILKNLSTRIYIIEAGEIDNFGTHDDLMKTENLYSIYWKDLQ